MLDVHCEVIDQYCAYAKGVDYDLRKHMHIISYLETSDDAIKEMIEMRGILRKLLKRIDSDIVELNKEVPECPT